jgi:hypothetical protein
MDSKIMNIYENMFRTIYESCRDYRAAWNRLIEFIMLNSYPKFLFMVDHKFEWFLENSSLVEKLMEIWNHDLLKSDNHDYLGDLLMKYGKELRFQYEREMVGSSTKTIEKIEQQLKAKKGKANILVIGTKTGRLLLRIHEANSNAVIYGIERDLNLYRIAFANCALHGMDFNLLCCDPLKHAFDHSTDNGKHNWQYANRWYPKKDRLRLMNADTRLHREMAKSHNHPLIV